MSIIRPPEYLQHWEAPPPPSVEQPTFAGAGDTTTDHLNSGCCDHFNPNLDPRKLRRMLANRESARRSRLRKVEYIEKLRKDVLSEEAKLSSLSPKVSFYEVQRQTLENENRLLKIKLDALAEVMATKEAEYRALMEERDWMNFMAQAIAE